MFTTRIKPKLSVKPLASRNRRAAKEIPLIAWRTPLFMRKLDRIGEHVRGAVQPAAPWAPPEPETGRLALVRAPLEEFLRLPGPELRNVLVGLERNVGQ